MKMTIMLITSLLGAGAGTAAALAAPVPTQNVGSADATAVQHRPLRTQKKVTKLATGEAARLQKAESDQAPEDASASSDAREENRGRVTSAHRAPLQPRQTSKTASQKQHNTAAHVSDVSQKHHTAEFKTGQLTTRQSAHLAPKQTSLHQAIHVSREQDGKANPEDQPNKNTNEIHLRKHNARMF